MSCARALRMITPLRMSHSCGRRASRSASIDVPISVGASRNISTVPSATSSPSFAPSARATARHSAAYRIANSDRSSRRNIPARRPVSTVRPATALTSSLRHAAVTKSGSQLAVPPAARHISANVVAEGPVGSGRRASPRSRPQPPACVSAENQTMPGMTVDDGQSGCTCSTCSTPFCSTTTMVFSSHRRASQRAPSAFWVALIASRTNPTGPVISAGSVHTGPGTTIGSPSSGRSSSCDRGVRPHTNTSSPAADRYAAMVVPTLPGPTTAISMTILEVTASRLGCRSHRPRGVFVLRSHAAGSLRATDAGQQVTLAGWVARRRDHGGVIFIDLRDASGVSQVVFRAADVLHQAHRLRAEFCVAVEGVVEIRPEGNANPEIATGEIEVNATSLTVLGECAPLPFQLDEPAGEEVRLRYRYLDLRREGPGNAIRLRSKVNAAARNVLAAHDFVEIETPTMTRSTPEGARDFLVPAPLQPGSFYALPQSPQLFKQLLMVAGMERYYQIARCYRDEDFRADRQPEFTQLDMELSFVEADDVIAISEQVLKAVWALIGYDLPLPVPRISYADAMRRFGSDRPDLRFGLELVECAEFFSDTTFRVFQAPYVGAVVMSGGASQPRRTLDGWQEWAKQRGHKGLAYVLVGDDGTLGGPVAKNLSDAERDGLAAHVGAQPGDCIFFSAGPVKSSRALLGAARIEIANRLG